MTTSRKAGAAKRMKRPQPVAGDAEWQRVEQMLARARAGIPCAVRRAAMAAEARALKHLHD